MLSEKRMDIINRLDSKDTDDTVYYFKQLILKELFKDKDLLEVLNNTQLEEMGAVPEDYHNVNIFSFLKIPDTQSVVKNFICFDVDVTEPSRENNVIASAIVRFRTIAHADSVQTEYGINRQDLLALIIRDIFSWSNIFGNQAKRIYDTSKASDNGYYYRDIQFLVTKQNDLRNGTTNNFNARY